MSEPKSILAELIERRDDVIKKLRDREPELVAQMTQLNAAIAGIEVGSVRRGQYSGFHSPSEAIFAYLDEKAKPQVREDMCRTLVNGGYRNGTETDYWILIRTVNYQVEKGRLVEHNGLIGKPTWPKALFEAKKESGHP